MTETTASRSDPGRPRDADPRDLAVVAAAIAAIAAKARPSTASDTAAYRVGGARLVQCERHDCLHVPCVRENWRAPNHRG